MEIKSQTKLIVCTYYWYMLINTIGSFIYENAIMNNFIWSDVTLDLYLYIFLSYNSI